MIMGSVASARGHRRSAETGECTMRPIEVIDSREIMYAGRRYTVTLMPDYDATPYDADCYSPDDIEWPDADADEEEE